MNSFFFNPFFPGICFGQTFYGTNGWDYFSTNNGCSDTYYTYDGMDRVWAGLGDDTVYAGEGDDMVWGEDGDDLIFGGGGNDTLYGGAGEDVTYGGDGDDFIEDLSLADGDFVDAGRGDDTAHIWGDGSVVLLGDGNDQASIMGSDSVLEGGAGNDSLTVNGGVDSTAYGGTGNDVLWIYEGTGYGEAGNDTLKGKNEALLIGGAGADRFEILLDQSHEQMTIEDFSRAGGDTLFLATDSFAHQLDTFSTHDTNGDGRVNGLDDEWSYDAATGTLNHYSFRGDIDLIGVTDLFPGDLVFV